MSIPAERIDSQEKIISDMKTTCSIGLVDIGVVTEELMKEKGFRGIRKCSDHVFSQCLKLLHEAKNSGKNRLYVTEIHDGVLVPVEYKNGTRD
jgi:hypothetical protein